MTRAPLRAYAKQSPAKTPDARAYARQSPPRTPDARAHARQSPGEGAHPEAEGVR